MILKSTQLQYELEQTITQKQAEIAAAVAAERKDILEDIRAKCKYFKVSYRELRAHLVRVPGIKKKSKKTRAKRQKFDVYGKQPSVAKKAS